MTTLKLSGYLTTAQAVTWTAATQKIDTLLNDEWTDLSDEIDNSTNKYAFADLYLELGAATWDLTDAGMEIYIVPTVNGTNYPDWTGGVATEQPEQSHYFVAFLPIKDSGASVAAKVVSSSQAAIELPNGKFKFGIRNRGNVTTAGSGNTLYWRPRSYDAV